MRKTILTLGLVLGLCACGPHPVTAGGQPPPVTQTDPNMLAAQKAMLGAEVAYNAVASAVLPLLESKTIHGVTATRVKDINAAATQALKLGYAAETASVKYDVANQLKSLTTQLEGVLGKVERR